MATEKRYQVFVSSTYEDLQDERKEVMQALLELNCIPAGMELFPASNEDQWTLIKKVIDDCDYYIVIIGGRYGSVDQEGVSFTEKEYRYAAEVNKPIIAFLHKTPHDLPAKFRENDKEKSESLDEFRKIAQAKMVRYWASASELGSVVSRSLVNLIRNHPAIGWIRADQASDEESAKEILKLRKQIDDMKHEIQINRTKAPEGTEKLSQGDDETEINYTVRVGRPMEWQIYKSVTTTTWNELFFRISPLLINEANNRYIISEINGLIAEKEIGEWRKDKKFIDQPLDRWSIDDSDFHTILVQLRALGLIAKSEKNRSVKDNQLYWRLTPYGDAVMERLRAIRRKEN